MNIFQDVRYILIIPGTKKKNLIGCHNYLLTNNQCVCLHSAIFFLFSFKNAWNYNNKICIFVVHLQPQFFKCGSLPKKKKKKKKIRYKKYKISRNKTFLNYLNYPDYNLVHPLPYGDTFDINSYLMWGPLIYIRIKLKLFSSIRIYSYRMLQTAGINPGVYPVKCNWKVQPGNWLPGTRFQIFGLWTWRVNENVIS